jgi:type I restriction enzyme S subunit
MTTTETKNTKVFYNTEIPIDWEVKKLGEISDINTGKKDNQNKVEGGLYPFFVRSQNIERINSYSYDGEAILIPGEGNIGEIFHFINGKFDYHQRVYKISDFKNVESKFIYHFISYFFKKETIKHSVKATVDSLRLPTFTEMQILLPPLAEQRSIAQVLSTSDAAIHTTENLIAQKELRKKWLMQQLLTGKKRVKGFDNTKWKIQTLENFIKPIVREVPKPNTPYLGIGLRSHGKGTFLKHDEQPEKNSMDNFYVVRPNDLIVNITFAWEQAIAIVRPEDDGALASHRFPTYTFIEDKGHPDFFRFYILQPRMKFMLQMISPGGAGRNRVMSKSDFIKLEFLLPDYKEQTAIAQVLQAADKEISLLKAKAERLREQKKGLMQVLLTGKVRLKINNT